MFPLNVNAWICLAGRLLIGIGAFAAASAAQDPLQEFTAIAERLEQSNALFVGGSREQDLRRRLATIPAGAPAAVEARVRLARELLRTGDETRALAQMQTALAAEADLWERGGPGFAVTDSTRRKARQQRLLFEALLAAVRLGERRNCVGNPTLAACLLPIVDEGVHAQPQPALQAMEFARQYLRLAPDDARGIWFLNLAAMQAGVWPEQVDPPLRLAAHRLAPAGSVGRFRDIAPAIGADTFDLAGGHVVDDFDGDGLFDIITSSMDPRRSLTFLRNGGDGTFVNATAGSGLDRQLGGLNLIHGDSNEDGRLDLFVLRGGWLQNRGRIRNSLLRNRGDGTFADVTHAAGLAEPALPTQAAAWADFDGDGDLDLAIGNEGERRDRSMHVFSDNLFRNDGDGRFVDVAAEVGMTRRIYAKGLAWGDIEGDGDADLYVSGVGPNLLYRNDGDTFVEVASARGVDGPDGRSFACWFFDVDNDGDLDLFVAGYEAGVEDIAADLMGRAVPDHLWPRLYRNDGGEFVDITQAAGLGRPSLPMGANFGDIDEDGHLDIYLGTGAPSFEAQMPNVLYHNQGDGSFVEATYDANVGHLQKGHGVSFADLDRDGDTDLAVQMGGFYPADRFANAMFDNPGHRRRWLAVQVVGTASARTAVGARLHVRVEQDGQPRDLYRWVGSGGSFGGSPLEQFFGLDQATRILFLEVDWPAGTRQRVTSIPLDSVVRLVEGQADVTILDVPRQTWATETPSRSAHRH